MSHIDTRRAREGLGLLAAAIHQAADLALRETVKETTAQAKATTLWQDHRGAEGTRQTIHGEVLGSRGKVIAGGVSRLLEHGTPPHIIEAARARTLHFFVNGSEVFRRRVKHPGTRPRPFMAIARGWGQFVANRSAAYFVEYAIHRVH